MITFGRKLNHLRQKNHLTQKELGIALGFPEDSTDIRITQYEATTRKPLDEILVKLDRDYEEKSVNKIFYDNDRRKTGMKSAFRLCFIYNSYKIACQERAGNPPVFLTFFIIPVSVPHT